MHLTNHVYILDGDLNIVGKLEDLASGEQIYSARFIGNKGYMVTFRQIDPLYVIDLSDPANPKVLGFLKIPGVSDYLHPYDENHVIGLGRDATEEGRMQGMKLSLFDVTDVQNPTEVSKYMIGDRGTSSEALNDHKAFLFSKEKNLLIIPVSLVEGEKWNAWNGVYVFSLDLENGFVLKGKVTHSNQTENETDYYYNDYQSQIRRSLYMDDMLYTISQKMIKMNMLTDMAEINNVSLPYEETVYPILYEEGVVSGI
ncbi:MAG: beta-propeller domain-containing protein [Candidatus Aenigmarchaeota archaeon]|nr:beta-propeller domain-containing protein [Candidatus Aenigmarchaeota archaeon]